MVVQHNITAMNSNRMLGLTTASQAKATQKLSSGYKINTAADDAAGLSISEKMRRQIRGLTQAAANAQDGISCVQTAEGALNEVTDMLQRMSELSVKGENETLTASDRVDIQNEVSQLMSEINRVQSTTTFNSQNLLTGEFTNKGLQVGAEQNQHITVDIENMNLNGLIGHAQVNSGGELTTQQATDVVARFSGLYTKASGTAASTSMEYDKALIAGEEDVASGKKVAATVTANAADKAHFTAGALQTGQAVGKIATADFQNLNKFAKSAIKTVSAQRSALGAVQNRLEHTINNLNNITENTTSAESAIRDTDMATQMVSYSNNNILAQAGTAMLAQANQSNQNVLSLL